MNDSHAETQGRLIDRLVTGDLNESARRELLAWLDREPARWRRCGLAFLEAQAWNEAFPACAALGERAASEVPAIGSCGYPDSAPTAFFGRTRGTATKRVKTLALAGSLLLAFGLGIAVRGITPNDSVSGGSDLRRTAAERHLTSSRGSAPPGAPKANERPTLSGAAQPRPAGDSSAAEPAGMGGIAGHVVVSQSTDDGRGWSVPVRHQRAAAHPAPPDALPEYVLKQLERHGFRLDRRRGSFRVELADGRRLEIPVDQIELRHAGKQVY